MSTNTTPEDAAREVSEQPRPKPLDDPHLQQVFGWAIDGAMASDRTTAMLFALLATGLITLVIWEGIFPDKRDSRILGVLPVRLRSLVVTRLAALGSSFLSGQSGD